MYRCLASPAHANIALKPCVHRFVKGGTGSLHSEGEMHTLHSPRMCVPGWIMEVHCCLQIQLVYPENRPAKSWSAHAGPHTEPDSRTYRDLARFLARGYQ